MVQIKVKGQLCPSVEMIPRDPVDFDVSFAITNEGDFQVWFYRNQARLAFQLFVKNAKLSRKGGQLSLHKTSRKILTSAVAPNLHLGVEPPL